MKNRNRIIAALLMLCMLLCGASCGKAQGEVDYEGLEFEKMKDMLAQYPASYSRSDAQNDGIVYCGNDGALNISLLTDYIASPKAGEYVTIVNYTVEGDPCFFMLSWDGERFNVVEDATRDQFGVRPVCYYSYEYIGEYSINGYSYFIVHSRSDMDLELMSAVLRGESEENISVQILCAYQK